MRDTKKTMLTAAPAIATVVIEPENLSRMMASLACECVQLRDSQWNPAMYGQSPDRLWHHPGGVACRREPDRDQRGFLHGLDIDHRDVVGMLVGHVGGLVVGRDH